MKVNYRSNDEGNYCLMPNFTHIFGNPSKKKKKNHNEYGNMYYIRWNMNNARVTKYFTNRW